MQRQLEYLHGCLSTAEGIQLSIYTAFLCPWLQTGETSNSELEERIRISSVHGYRRALCHQTALYMQRQSGDSPISTLGVCTLD